MIIHVRRSKNSNIPTTIIMIPPILMISCWRFLIHVIFVMKKDRTKNGTANPNTYAIIYVTADSGLLPASVITADKIGPVQGVHPAAKPIPMRIDPKKPAGRFLNCILFSPIRKEGWKTPRIIKPKKIMRMAPTWRIA